MEIEKRKADEELVDISKKQKVADEVTETESYSDTKEVGNKENGTESEGQTNVQTKANDTGPDINSNGPASEENYKDVPIPEAVVAVQGTKGKVEVNNGTDKGNHTESETEMECKVDQETADETKLVTDTDTGECDAQTQNQTEKEAKAPDADGDSGVTSQVTAESDEKKVDMADKKSGTLLICGGMNWDLVGRRDLPKTAKGSTGRNLWSPHRLGALSSIRVKYVASGPAAAHSVIVTTEGKVLSWGRNEKGQLGMGDLERRDKPTEMENVQDFQIVNASCGRNHTLLLTECGTVFACGDNKHGQCGIGNQHPVVHTPNRIAYKGRAVTKVACGGEFSVILDCKGYLHTFGYPEYGQLGHNTDGRYIEKAKKVSYSCEVGPKRVAVYIEKHRDGHVTPVDSVHIVDMACGVNHTVAIDAKKRCYTWGFGGYGRLGHASPKDEYVPRLLKFFDGPNRGVTSVYAGSTFCLAINELGALYMWGQTKRSGEANMYPKPVSDLTGWGIRDIACANTSVVIAADESVIAWGPSPTHGELGFGEMQKSSTQPKEVRACDGMHVTQVACGMGHTLMVARDHTEAERERITKLPEYAV